MTGAAATRRPILAIDSATRDRLTCVLVAGGTVAAGGSAAVPPGAVQPALARAVAELLPAELGAVVCVLGPGSYTGIRAGLAAGLGISHATGAPLHGAGSLEVVAQTPLPAGTAGVTAVADAGRGGVYVAGFDVDGRGRRAPRDRPRRVAVGELRAPPGDVVAVLEGELARRLRAQGGPPVVAAHNAAPLLAAAAATALERPPLDPAGIRPLYLAPPA